VKNGVKSLRDNFFKEGMRCVLVVTTISRKFEASLNNFILCFVSNISFFHCLRFELLFGIRIPSSLNTLTPSIIVVKNCTSGVALFSPSFYL
jgi:hypothetical protein